jgi:WD40 repeat protein
MTATELKEYINLQLAVPLNLVSKLKSAMFAMVDFTTSSVTSIIPDWTNEIIFNTTGPNIYCTFPDTDGNKKLWQTKTDGNIGNQPPTAPATHEDTYWLEVSASASAAIPEWAPGLYGPGLVIVYHNHTADGKGLYVLNEPVRPFNSTNIETELTALKWELISGGSSIEYFVGGYASLVALQTAHPTGNPGEYAFVDTGVGTDTVMYIWDSNDSNWDCHTS